MKFVKRLLLSAACVTILIVLLIGFRPPSLVYARIGNDSAYQYVIKDMDKMVVVTVPPKSVARAMVYRGSVESLLAERRVGTRKIIARVVVVSQRTGYGLSGRETHVKLSVDTKSEKAGPADWWPLSWHYSERRSSTTKYLHAGLKNADLQTNS
nr:hypothetical protein [Fimbriimonadaceae bacterium]